MKKEEMTEQEQNQLFKDFGTAKLPGGKKLMLPPPCATEMNVRFIEYISRKKLVCSFPVKKKYLNPIGVMQGGFITAAIDNTMGPLSFLAAKNPAVTLDLHTTYIRGIPEGDTLTVEAEVKSRGLGTMYIKAKAFNSKNKLIAEAISQSYILKNKG